MPQGYYPNENRARGSRSGRYKHGMSESKAFALWMYILNRCYCKSSSGYRKYGARGIAVCERWRNSFKNFYADMGDRPPGMSIERIDNNGPYSPENCKWATRKEQASNTRRNVIVEANGKRLTLTDWANELGLSPSALTNRIKRGMSPEEAVTAPRTTNERYRAILRDGLTARWKRYRERNTV